MQSIVSEILSINCLPLCIVVILQYHSLVFLSCSVQSNVYWPNVHSINLTLVNVSRDDNFYMLTCIAENKVGMANASIQLTVHCT